MKGSRHYIGLLSGVVACIYMHSATTLAETSTQDLFNLSLKELTSIPVKIATGTPQPLRSTAAVTSVITGEELQAMGVQTLDEALEAVPGLHVSRAGQRYTHRFFIRGIVSQFNPHALVLINGSPARANIVTGGSHGPDLNLPLIAPERVERIEIIRGPGSAVHGADAFAGIINIVTRHPEEVVGGETSISHGSYDTTRISALQSSDWGPVQALYTVAHRRTDGDDRLITSDAQSAVDAQGNAPPASLAPGPLNLGIKQSELSLDLSWDDFLLRANLNQVRDMETGQGSADALDPLGRFERDAGGFDVTWAPASVGDWRWEGGLSYYLNSRRASRLERPYPPGSFEGRFPDGLLQALDVVQERAQIELSTIFRGVTDHQMRVGGGVVWADAFKIRHLLNADTSVEPLSPFPGGVTDVSDTPAAFIPQEQRVNRYAYIQDEWSIASGWALTSGLRHDHFSDFGDAINPRAGLVWSASPTLTTKLLYGEAFRAPTFIDLYSTSLSAGLGNPALNPERIKSTELAFSFAFEPDWLWDVNVYRFRISDLIDFRPVADSDYFFRAENVGGVEGKGLETELRRQWGDSLQWLVNYSHQQTDDEARDAPLGLAPDEKVYLRAIWNMSPQWQLTPQLTWIGTFQRQAGDTRSDLGGYTTLDMTLRWIKPGEDLSLALIGRNLSDADVREPSRGPGMGQTVAAIPGDLPQQGRSLMLEVSTQW